MRAIKCHLPVFSLLLVATSLLVAGCASVAKIPDRWDVVAVRVDAFFPETMHVSPVSGSHESFDEITGTIISAGKSKNQKLRFSRASAETLEVGQIYVVKLYEHIGRSTRSDTNPPEWCIVKEPNQPPEPTR